MAAMSESKTRIIVVDDDARLRELLNRYSDIEVTAPAQQSPWDRWRSVSGLPVKVVR